MKHLSDMYFRTLLFIFTSSQYHSCLAGLYLSINTGEHVSKLTRVTPDEDVFEHRSGVLYVCNARALQHLQDCGNAVTGSEMAECCPPLV